MEVKFQRWGNSVAVRIPAPALREMGIKAGDPADLTVAEGKLVLTPSSRRRRIRWGRQRTGKAKRVRG